MRQEVPHTVIFTDHSVTCSEAGRCDSEVKEVVKVDEFSRGQPSMNRAGKFNLLNIAPTTAAVVGIFLHLKVKKDEKHAVRVK